MSIFCGSWKNLYIFSFICSAPRTAIGNNWWFITFYQTIIYFGVSLVIPTFIMVFVTCNLIGSLKAAREKKAKMTAVTNQSQVSKDGKGSGKDLTLTLITVVVVFVFCNIFNLTRRAIINVYGDKAGKCPHFLYPFTSLTATIHIFNASVNFAIYVLFCKTFRNRVKSLLLCSTNRVGHLETRSANKVTTKEQSLRF